jgi:hypothetical protein
LLKLLPSHVLPHLHAIDIPPPSLVHDDAYHRGVICRTIKTIIFIHIITFIILLVHFLSTTAAHSDARTVSADPILWELIAEADTVSMSHLEIAQIADHHQMGVPIALTDIAEILAVIDLHKHSSILVHCLISCEYLKFFFLFCIFIKVSDGIKSLLAERASVCAICAPVLDALEAKLMTTILDSGLTSTLHLTLANSANFLILSFLNLLHPGASSLILRI